MSKLTQADRILELQSGGLFRVLTKRAPLSLILNGTVVRGK
jgi:hypothetical protein